MKDGVKEIIKPYKVVVVVSFGTVAPYIMFDVASALKKLGHNVKIVDIRDLESKANGRQLAAGLIRDIKLFSPDFALSYGFSGLFPNAYENVFMHIGVPAAGLFFDNPFAKSFLDLYKKLDSTKLFRIFIWDKYYRDELKEYGFESHYLPLAANEDRFKPMSPVDSYESDVTFVGTISGTTDYDKDRREKKWPEWLIDVGRKTVERKLKDRSLSVEAVARSVIKESLPQEALDSFDSYENKSEFTVFLSSIYNEYGNIVRSEAVRLLPKAKVRIVGEGWEGFVREGVTVGGRVDYTTEAPQIYNSAKINLNITGAQLMKSVNQRVFDVSACGAFLLTDYRDDLSELFDTETEIAVYNDMAGMRKKVRYYLEHDEERRVMAARARERVLKEHTYCHRVKTIISALESDNLI